MAELSDGFVALPGGYGTLEEFLEVLSWAQLSIRLKPCALLDVDGFFGPLPPFSTWRWRRASSTLITAPWSSRTSIQTRC
jgi:predicted Rossmann-fold nucleotide-binding protein